MSKLSWTDAFRLTYLSACTAGFVVVVWAGIDMLIGRSTDYSILACGAWTGSAVTLVAARWVVKP